MVSLPKGTTKALSGPTGQVLGACSSCSVCAAAERLLVLSRGQRSTVPSPLAPSTGCCSTS